MVVRRRDLALFRRIGEHVRSNVVAYLALFVALGAAPAWAVTIGASDIQRNAVRSRHIKAKNVRRADLAIGAVNSRRVANGSLRGVDIDETTLSRIGAGVLGGQWRNLISGNGNSSRSPAGNSLGPEAIRWLSPVPLVLTRLRVNLTTPPGAGDSRTFRIVGADPDGGVIGSLTCTVTGATESTCGSGVQTVKVPAGGFYFGGEGATGSPSAAYATFGYRVLTR
jgi:hypothetical protein